MPCEPWVYNTLQRGQTGPVRTIAGEDRRILSLHPPSLVAVNHRPALPHTCWPRQSRIPLITYSFLRRHNGYAVRIKCCLFSHQNSGAGCISSERLLNESKFHEIGILSSVMSQSFLDFMLGPFQRCYSLDLFSWCVRSVPTLLLA